MYSLAWQTTLKALADVDPLPPLLSTGWEETMLLAAAMASDCTGFLTTLMEHNLPLAGRCAAQPEVEIPVALKDKIRQALVQRTQNPAADLRARIAAGLALGEVGDPRFVRQQGPWGSICCHRCLRSLVGRMPLAVMRGVCRRSTCSSCYTAAVRDGAISGDQCRMEPVHAGRGI